MTEEELDLAEMVLCLTNKLNLLKTELTHAQSYKDDAERYRFLRDRNPSIDIFGTDADTIDATIDQAMNESKLTNGETK